MFDMQAFISLVIDKMEGRLSPSRAHHALGDASPGEYTLKRLFLAIIDEVRVNGYVVRKDNGMKYTAQRYNRGWVLTKA